MRALATIPVAVTLAVTAHVLAPPPPQGDDLYDAPAGDLDPRIDASKMTELGLPPLPERVVLPLPPDHRIAADRSTVPIGPSHWRAAECALAAGADYLRSMQRPNGSWLEEAEAKPTADPNVPPTASPVSVAVTAMAVKALVQADPAAVDSPAVRRAIGFIAESRQADGGYTDGSLANYVTATVVSALSGVDEFAFSDEIAGGVEWLPSNQWDQGEGLAADKDWFGGAGYGNRGRPDMSNTQMMLDALYDAGLSPDEPAFQRALAFTSRAQNLQATNDAAWAGNDGGFVYTPANNGESMASEVAGEGRWGEHMPPDSRSLRSYGSMTYAGFKSMLYAGLSPDDIRVRAAFDWIRRHWTFEENPGLGLQGHYYYLHTMSRALRVAQQHVVDDVHGDAHNWREEIIDAIVDRQTPDGSWANEADRWMEGDPVLATTYALLALEEALKPALAPVE
jgi:squalene-hopene/tetraprenyl-beta-curcumene cyclase